jgi:hypothetical protein
MIECGWDSPFQIKTRNMRDVSLLYFKGVIGAREQGKSARSSLLAMSGRLFPYPLKIRRIRIEEFNPVKPSGYHTHHPH